MTDNNNNGKNTLNQVGQYLGLGTQLAATIVIMVFIGKWLDGKFNTGSLYTLICAFIGGGAGLYNFIKTVLDIEKKSKNEP